MVIGLLLLLLQKKKKRANPPGKTPDIKRVFL